MMMLMYGYEPNSVVTTSSTSNTTDISPPTNCDGDMYTFQVDPSCPSDYYQMSSFSITI